MLTVQEIQAMSFEKAVFGGYDMKSVDEFVEQLTEDFATMQKENAALKSKMKVLVDKIEEYRSVEDGMRKALVSAQNIAQETIEQAKKEATDLIEQSHQKAEDEIQRCIQQVTLEQSRLKTAREQSAEFISKMTGLYENQIKSLISLSTGADLQIDTTLAEQQSEALQEKTDKEPTQRFATVTTTADVRPTASSAEYHIPDDIQAFMKKYEQGGSVAQETTKPSVSEVPQAAAPSVSTAASPETAHKEDGMQIKVMEVTLGGEKGDLKTTDSKPKFQFGDLKFGSDYSTESEEKKR